MDDLRVEIVQSEALWERVVTALRRAIVMGEFAPGSHLKEPVLAQRFGISRLPIREALAQLDREGLVRIEPRRGAFVIGVTHQDISDIYACRLMLETYAIRQAAGRVGDDDVALLDMLCDQMSAAVTANQPQLVATADMAFHRKIVALSGNRALSSAWEPLAPLIETILGIAEVTCRDLPVAAHSHWEMTRALEQHDPDRAEALIDPHLRHGEDLVHEAIESVREAERAV